MSNPIYTASVPVFASILTNAKTWLDKGAAFADHKKFDVSILLQSRLAPDMFHLTRQFQAISDQAKGAVARLQGIAVPSFEDNEVTVADLHARLDKTIAFVKSADVEKMKGAEDRVITVRPGREFKNGSVYLHHYVLPNFYFHATAAYAILRNNGVDVGKNDFLGKLDAYLV